MTSHDGWAWYWGQSLAALVVTLGVLGLAALIGGIAYLIAMVLDYRNRRRQ